MSNLNQAKQIILDSMANGIVPNNSTIGNYEVAMEAIKQLQEEGKIKWAKVPSKSGKRMMNRLILC